MRYNNKKKLELLFDKYYNGLLTDSEKDELFAIISNTDEGTIDRLTHEAWNSLQPGEQILDKDKSEQIRHFILKNERIPFQKNRRILQNVPNWVTGIAAMLIMGLITSLFFYRKAPLVQAISQINRATGTDVFPGGNQAYLKLANGEKIVLNDQKKGVLAIQGGVSIQSSKNGQIVYHKSVGFNNSLLTQYNTLITPSGGQHHLILVDGTEVWLNAESSLKYPVVFNSKERIVELVGEAYFQVAKDPRKPFRVRSNGTYIKVLGTHFNVMAYANEVLHKTTLVEGAIEISNGKQSYQVSPGEQVREENNVLEKPIQVNIRQEIAWKDGFFEFRKADLNYIMRQISRWYNVKVIYNNNAGLQRYTGRISRNVKLSALLNMLQYTGLKYKIDGRTITIIE